MLTISGPLTTVNILFSIFPARVLTSSSSRSLASLIMEHTHTHKQAALQSSSHQTYYNTWCAVFIWRWQTELLCVVVFCFNAVSPPSGLDWNKTCQYFWVHTLSECWCVWLMRGQLPEADRVRRPQPGPCWILLWHESPIWEVAKDKKKQWTRCVQQDYDRTYELMTEKSYRTKQTK